MAKPKVENVNTGFIIKNKFKTSDKHPVWKGWININGDQWEIAMWNGKIKTGESAGDPMFNVTMQTSEDADKYKKKESSNQNYTDDDMPF
jgi:hypothetical protein